ncbi:hypothetical protein V8G54_007440 [Vigna mungo]|uniref:Uncharacterized protein n=1 Tax=Vigna mungo TaxID=3915 RepID=A0AAQ3S8A1_VIGMU
MCQGGNGIVSMGVLFCLFGEEPEQQLVVVYYISYHIAKVKVRAALTSNLHAKPPQSILQTSHGTVLSFPEAYCSLTQPVNPRYGQDTLAFITSHTPPSPTTSLYAPFVHVTLP